MENCGSCRFFRAGSCVRNAPVRIGAETQFPAVSQHSWCGQYAVAEPRVPRRDPDLDDAMLFLCRYANMPLDALEAMAPDAVFQLASELRVAARRTQRIGDNPRSAEDIHD